MITTPFLKSEGQRLPNNPKKSSCATLLRLSTLRAVLTAVTLTVAGGSGAQADTTLNFEGFPDSTILTTQYPGLTFTNGISLNEFEFPPHSGVNVVSDNNGPITIDFSMPTTSFSGYFTYVEPLTLDAFNASDTEVSTATSKFSNNLACLGGPPCPGDPGSSPNEFIELGFAGGISSVTIMGDPLGGSFTMDDMSYTSAVPEPNSVFLVFMWVIIFHLLLKRDCAPIITSPKP
jgi:hypothetical protein